MSRAGFNWKFIFIISASFFAGFIFVNSIQQDGRVKLVSQSVQTSVAPIVDGFVHRSPSRPARIRTPASEFMVAGYVPSDVIDDPRVSKGPQGWGIIGSEIAGVLALGAVFMSRFKPSSSPPSPLHSDSASGKVHNWATSLTALLLAMPPDAALAAEQATRGYSQASYYTALGTYLIALPGLISLVTRSVKPKIVRKTYVMPGPGNGGMPQKEIAGKLLFYLTKKRSFELKDAGKTVTFKGKLALRKGQATYLTLCVFLSLLSLGLVIQTIENATFGEGQGLGNWWYALSLLSPLAGKYYLDNAGGEQELQLKIVSDDDEKETEVTIQGDDAELEMMRLEFNWEEKGMVRVKGLFEDQITQS